MDAGGKKGEAYPNLPIMLANCGFGLVCFCFSCLLHCHCLSKRKLFSKCLFLRDSHAERTRLAHGNMTTPDFLFFYRFCGLIFTLLSKSSMSWIVGKSSSFCRFSVACGEEWGFAILSLAGVCHLPPYWRENLLEDCYNCFGLKAATPQREEGYLYSMQSEE